jgi:6-phosphogluconolactonase
VSPNEAKIVVLPDAQAIAHRAAERLLARIGEASRRVAVCLTGGAGPRELYELLAREPYRSRMPWHRVHWFMGDDRFVPLDHPLSNMGMARRLFLDHVSAPDENIHPIPTTLASPDAAARAYEAELKRFYGREALDPARPLFELVLMGLGPEGHTASLFPNAPALLEQERWAVGIDQAGMEPFVPRVTLTFPPLASSGEMLFLVAGEDKRDILGRVFSGADLPAGRARSHGELVWLVDPAAASAVRHVS